MVARSNRSPSSLTSSLQVLREVVQPQRPGMRDAERVEQIVAVELLEDLAALGGPTSAGSSNWPSDRVVADRADRVVVRHQRVHAVDGDELLGERVRRGVVIGRRAGDAAQQLVVVEAGEHLLQVARAARTSWCCSAVLMTGCGRIAGVHSTVWILAISAALTRRACWNSRSSSQVGKSCFRRSQMALCSSANSACSRLRPTHEFSVKPVISRRLIGSTSELAVGRRPAPCRRGRPAASPAGRWSSRRPASRPTSGSSR